MFYTSQKNFKETKRSVFKVSLKLSLEIFVLTYKDPNSIKKLAKRDQIEQTYGDH